MHCHIAGIGAGGSGCFVSPKLRDNWRFNVYLRAFGVTRKEVEKKATRSSAKKFPRRSRKASS